MITDALTSFVPIGTPLSCVGATGATFASNVVDLLGSGVGTAPANIIGNATVFGEDVGVGGDQAELNVVVGTAFVTGGSATLNVQFQASADDATTHQPSSWVTLEESGTISAANLTAGQVIFRTKFPPSFPANLNPRYLRLNFVTPSGQSFSAGTIASAIPTMVRDDQANRNAAANFKVA